MPFEDFEAYGRLFQNKNSFLKTTTDKNVTMTFLGGNGIDKCNIHFPSRNEMGLNLGKKSELELTMYI